MEIKLDDSYRIKGDAHQYILEQKCNHRWLVKGYYVRLETLLLDFLDSRVRTSDVKSIKELMRFQKSLVTTLNKALQPLKFKLVRENSRVVIDG